MYTRTLSLAGVGLYSRFDPFPPMLPEVPAEEFAAALDACAEDALWEAGLTAPPIDAFQLAERLEMLVTHNQDTPHRAQFVRLAERHAGGDGQATIVVGAADRPERAQWA